MSGDFPPPPTADPAAALHDQAVASLQRLHNYLATDRPKALAAGKAAGQDVVAVAVDLLQRLPPER